MLYHNFLVLQGLPVPACDKYNTTKDETENQIHMSSGISTETYSGCRFSCASGPLDTNWGRTFVLPGEGVSWGSIESSSESYGMDEEKSCPEATWVMTKCLSAKYSKWTA